MGGSALTVAGFVTLGAVEEESSVGRRSVQTLNWEFSPTLRSTIRDKIYIYLQRRGIDSEAWGRNQCAFRTNIIDIINLTPRAVRWPNSVCTPIFSRATKYDAKRCPMWIAALLLSGCYEPLSVFMENDPDVISHCLEGSMGQDYRCQLQLQLISSDLRRVAGQGYFVVHHQAARSDSGQRDPETEGVAVEPASFPSTPWYRLWGLQRDPMGCGSRFLSVYGRHAQRLAKSALWSELGESARG